MAELTCPFCGLMLAEHLAGRCLDAWVAVVQGIEQPPFRDNLYYGDHTHAAYSEDWGAAGPLLDEMRAVDVELCTIENGYGCALWSTWPRREMWCGNTGPLAITRAYLAWGLWQC